MTTLYWQITPSFGVALTAENRAVFHQLSRIFDGRTSPIAPPDRILCRIDLVADAVAPPTDPAFFIDERLGPSEMIGNVQVHGRPGELEGIVVYFNKLARVDYQADTVQIKVCEPVFKSGKFEDVVFTAVAPLLRRRGMMMVHAFAACRRQDGRVIMLVGKSGSGKTTTGLKLLRSGWRLLGNDITLLSERDGQIWGWPTPGIVSIRKPTFELLPELQPLQRDPKKGVDLTSAQLGEWGNPGPVSAVYFPEVADRHDSWCDPLPQTLALAYLMEESVDRWDKPTLPDQITFLNRLAGQADLFTLTLGRLMSQIPEIV